MIEKILKSNWSRRRRITYNVSNIKLAGFSKNNARYNTKEKHWKGRKKDVQNSVPRKKKSKNSQINKTWRNSLLSIKQTCIIRNVKGNHPTWKKMIPNGNLDIYTHTIKSTRNNYNYEYIFFNFNICNWIFQAKIITVYIMQK